MIWWEARRSPKECHEEWCHLLKTALEDYKHEKTLGHQVQKYVPPIETTYKALPASTRSLSLILSLLKYCRALMQSSK